ncbi:MAG TPA: FAD-dependent oxidoreductase, partial [Nocardioides sp.]
PRVPSFPGVDHAKVVRYDQVLSGAVRVGAKVAVIGAGGIGVDMSHFLAEEPHDGSAADLDDWMAHWGVGDPSLHRGGLMEKKARTPLREVWLLQRKSTAIGRGLAKTSGWAHRAVLKDSGVHLVPGVSYDKVDDAGLHITVTSASGEVRSQVLDVDHVVLCAGQESVRALHDSLTDPAVVDGAASADPAVLDVAAARGPRRVHLIGGADVAAELDAKRAIEQGTRVAAAL